LVNETDIKSASHPGNGQETGSFLMKNCHWFAWL